LAKSKKGKITTKTKLAKFISQSKAEMERVNEELTTEEDGKREEKRRKRKDGRKNTSELTPDFFSRGDTMLSPI
jgi:uncharacterized protein YwgA